MARAWLPVLHRSRYATRQQHGAYLDAPDARGGWREGGSWDVGFGAEAQREARSATRADFHAPFFDVRVAAHDDPPRLQERDGPAALEPPRATLEVRFHLRQIREGCEGQGYTGRCGEHATPLAISERVVAGTGFRSPTALPGQLPGDA